MTVLNAESVYFYLLSTYVFYPVSPNVNVLPHQGAFVKTKKLTLAPYY